MGQQDSLYPILLYTSFCKYTSLTHNLLPSLRTKTKPWARRTPPEPGSGRSLRSRAGVGSRPLRKCVYPTGLPLKEAKDQAAAGGTEDASHGEAPTRSVPQGVARGGGWGSRDTEATAPCSRTDRSSSPRCRTGGSPSGDCRPALREGGALARQESSRSQS